MTVEEEMMEKVLEALRDVKSEHGKVELICCPQGRIRMQVYGTMTLGGEDEWQFKREREFLL